MWQWNSGRPTTGRKAGYAPDEDLSLNMWKTSLTKYNFWIKFFLNVTNSWLYMILFIQVEMWYMFTYKVQIRYLWYIVAYC